MKSLFAFVATLALFAALGTASAQAGPGTCANGFSTINVVVGSSAHFLYDTPAGTCTAQVPGASLSPAPTHATVTQDAGGVGGWTVTGTSVGTDNVTASAPGYVSQPYTINVTAATLTTQPDVH